MRTSRHWGILLAVLGLSFLLAPAAQAGGARGAVISLDELSRADRQRLIEAVATARQQNPVAFEAIRRLREALPQLARRQRGRMVTVVRPLRALGPDGLMPMLSELAVEASPRGSLSERAWRGWRVSLLEAVGSLRDSRTMPVLLAILERHTSDAFMARAAATALARLGSDEAASLLIQRLGQGEKNLQHAILPALGECRRLVATRALVKTLNAAARGSWAEREALSALGQVGNSWAWRTPAVKHSGEGDAVRRAALEALISIYPQLADESREVAYKAVLLIDHPQTRAIMVTAQSRQKGAASEALGQLAQRVAHAKSPR